MGVKNKSLKIISVLCALLFILNIGQGIKITYAEEVETTEKTESEIIEEELQDMKMNAVIEIDPNEYRTSIDNIKKENDSGISSIYYLQQQLDFIKNSEGEIRDKINIIKEQLMYISQEITYTEEILAKYDVLEKEKKNEYETAKIEEEKQYEILCKRVRTMEEMKKVSYWEIIFNAKNIKDLVERLDVVSEIIEYDKNIFSKLTESKEKARDSWDEILEIQNDYKCQQTSLEKRKIEFEQKNEELSEIIKQAEKVYNDIYEDYQISNKDIKKGNYINSGLTEKEIESYIKFARKELEDANIADELIEKRLEILRVGLSGVGKISYFWGGRVYNPGWCDEWGTQKPIECVGSSWYKVGTMFPYGLDCGGFVFWCALTMYGEDSWNSPVKWMAPKGAGKIYQSEEAHKIPFESKLPGDITVNIPTTHIGYYLCTVNGKELYLHCAGRGGVIISDIETTGGFCKAAQIIY